MYPVSGGFLTALRSGAREWQCKVEVWQDGDLQATITDVVGGSVTVEQDGECRRKLTLTLANTTPEWVVTPVYPDEDEYGPDGTTFADGLFSDQPYSEIAGLFIPRVSELRVFEALKVSGTWEWVPLGVFRLVDFTASNTGDTRTFTLNAEDLSVMCRGAGFETPVTFQDDAAESVALVYLLNYCLPSHPYEFVTGYVETVLPQMTLFDGNAWSEMQAIAQSGGHEVFFDVEGTLVVREVPDYDGTPVEDFTADADDVKFSVSRSVSEAEVYSGVRVQGTHPKADEDCYATVWDGNPASPTYYLGPFGKKLLTESRDRIKTTVRAARAADALLRRVSGWDEVVEVQMAKHPALDVSDVVTMSEGTVGMSDPATYIVEQIAYPLGPGVMSVRARRRFTL